MNLVPITGSNVSGGKTWFDTSSFANPAQPTYTATELPSSITPPVFGNTNRNEFRGPGVSVVNASIFRSFHVYHESEFQIRMEAFNVANHALLYSNPNTTVGASTFGRNHQLRTRLLSNIRLPFAAVQRPVPVLTL